MRRKRYGYVKTFVDSINGGYKRTFIPVYLIAKELRIEYILDLDRKQKRELQDAWRVRRHVWLDYEDD